VVNILSPCPTFHHGEGPGGADGLTLVRAISATHDVGNHGAALAVAFGTGAPCVGLLYQVERPLDDFAQGAALTQGPPNTSAILEAALDEHRVEWR